MPRPKTKDELLRLAHANFERLEVYVEDCPKEEQLREFPKGTLNRNIRDVLAHLHHWHLMFLEWYRIGITGVKPEMPAKGYTWKTLPELNKEIQKRYSNTDLEKVKSLLKSSFGEVFNIIESHSDEELFTKKKYGWTGSTSLGAYLISATSSHYDWALKLIKKAKS
ncbi:ClbS/DfsB family four-helix bundle protein [Allomuricauda sp. SCSIO 65647]|uniref:ClbS/DfsB family four-helix bundle protein n=1 Tax=Allomuricauda sp. SCSIO 65647 TaxID=2908843 RepID=UPI001F480F36|nr:ClbS/DfsB family four-helix bundle protein [Muricauda sp. SCSIO 65647]UJH68480.1 ClbS/DfsB family four-helix bundle protein [Muricauda sp. SCSIO 65647]